MEIERRAVIACGLAAIAAAQLGPEARAATASLAGFVAKDGKSIKAVRVFTGKDGHSAFEEIDLPGATLGGSGLTQFLNRKATEAAIYSAPRNHKTAMRAASGDGEMLFVAQGGMSVATHGGSRRCDAGTLLLFEDTSGSGHSEAASAIGYMAIKVRLAGGAT